MAEELSFPQMMRALATDPGYREALTKQLAARTVDEGILRELIAYARSRDATWRQAIARKALTDAGVSWEAL